MSSIFPYDTVRGDISCDVTLIDVLYSSNNSANFYKFVVIDDSFVNPTEDWITFDTCNGNTQFDCNLDLFYFNISTAEWTISDRKSDISSTDTQCVTAKFIAPFSNGTYFVRVDEKVSSPSMNDYTLRMLCSDNSAIKLATNYTSFTSVTDTHHHEEQLLMIVIYALAGLILFCILFLVGYCLCQRCRNKPRFQFQDAIQLRTHKQSTSTLEEITPDDMDFQMSSKPAVPSNSMVYASTVIVMEDKSEFHLL